MLPEDYTLANLSHFVGREVGVSRWTLVDQERIDRFAECTGDDQWIHTDPERVAREMDGALPVAHGYLTLSLLPRLRRDMGIYPPEAPTVLNYGIDRVRFLRPVYAGSHVRVRCKLIEITFPGPNRILMKTSNRMEIQDSKKPALLADTLALLLTES